MIAVPVSTEQCVDIAEVDEVTYSYASQPHVVHRIAVDKAYVTTWADGSINVVVHGFTINEWTGVTERRGNTGYYAGVRYAKILAEGSKSLDDAPAWVQELVSCCVWVAIDLCSECGS